MSNSNLNNQTGKPKFYTIDTSSNSNSTKQSKITIVDPNKNPDGTPRKNNTDDLIFYMSLKAQRRNKVLTLDTPNDSQDDNNTNTILISSQIKASSVNFSNPNKQSDFLTTKWTDLFNETKFKNYESFGIKDIKIKINASMIPEVDITFVDIRAKTLFEGGNDPDNPYNLFFNLPYPLFHLTVKGYYGKGIELPLQLVKSNTKLDSSTGNYEMSCKFTSWTFGILNDLIMFYAFVTPFMYLVGDGIYEGQKKINEIFERQRQKEGNDFPFKSRFHNGNNNYPNIYDLSKLDKELAKVGGKVSVGYDANKLIQDYEIVYKRLLSLKTDIDILNNITEELFKDLITIYNDDINTYDIASEDIIKSFEIDYKNFNPNDPNFKITFIRYINDKLTEIIEKKNNIKDTLTNQYTNESENQLGYKPTIENILRIILNNMQAFIELLDEKSAKAIRQIDTNQKKYTFDNIEHYKLISTGEQKLLPFPDFYNTVNNTYEKTFPTNVEPEQWEEIRFINEIFLAKNSIEVYEEIGINEENNTTTYLNVTNNIIINEIISEGLNNTAIKFYSSITSSLTTILNEFNRINKANFDNTKKLNDNDKLTPEQFNEKYFFIMGELIGANIININKSETNLSENDITIMETSLRTLTTGSEVFLNEIEKLNINNNIENKYLNISIFGDVSANYPNNNLYTIQKLLDTIANISNSDEGLLNLLDLSPLLNYTNLLTTNYAKIESKAPSHSKFYNSNIYDNQIHIKYN